MSSVERSTEIAADAEQLSISRSTSNSQSTVGLGTLSGRAILAVGELAVRGVETVHIAVTLQRIGSRLRADTSQITTSDLRDLLELQRIGLYPGFVRRKAWALLYILLDRKHISSLIASLLKWPPVEIQLFIRQLAVYHLTGWAVVPQDYLKTASSDAENRVNDSLCHILLAILQHDPPITHETYDLYKYARLISGRHNKIVGELGMKARNSLSYFFDCWILCLGQSDEEHTPVLGQCMIQYLITGSPMHLQVVVDHVMAAIHLFVYLPNEEEDPGADMHMKVDNVFDQYPTLKTLSSSLAHPTFPFLSFAHRLSGTSDEAATLFLNAGLVDVIIRLHDIRYEHGRAPPTDGIHFMDVLCQSLVDLLCPGTILQSRSRLASQYTYPHLSVSSSRAQSVLTSTTPRRQDSSDSLSSLRAVFRMRMPSPPPPLSPILPRVPPPSPNMSFIDLSRRGSEETLTSSSEIIKSTAKLSGRLVIDDDNFLPTTPYSLSQASPASSYADIAGTDCATVGVKSLSSRFPSRRSTMRRSDSGVHSCPPSSLQPEVYPSDAHIVDLPSGALQEMSDCTFLTYPSTLLFKELSWPIPSSPTLVSDEFSAESESSTSQASRVALSGHETLVLVDDCELPLLDSESYFDHFDSVLDHDPWVADFSSRAPSRTRRIARRLVQALQSLNMTERGRT